MPPFVFQLHTLSLSLQLRNIKVEAEVALMAISSSCAGSFTLCTAYLLN